MTDLKDVFEDEDGEEGDADVKEESEDEEVAEKDEQFASPRRKVIAPSALDVDSSDSESESDEEPASATAIAVDPASDSDDDGDEPAEPAEEGAEADSDLDSDEGVKEKEKKRKKKDKLSGRPAKKGRNDVGAVGKGFFSGSWKCYLSLWLVEIYDLQVSMPDQRPRRWVVAPRPVGI
ncbi:hypothetical protein PENSPDRAFT_403080 [Peniophora sp. CONT]|nr:hypothetical protein PENSPDRAFT_403080 [Peniophora sp. CONT]